jgi:hypothetical protein
MDNKQKAFQLEMDEKLRIQLLENDKKLMVKQLEVEEMQRICQLERDEIAKSQAGTAGDEENAAGNNSRSTGHAEQDAEGVLRELEVFSVDRGCLRRLEARRRNGHAYGCAKRLQLPRKGRTYGNSRARNKDHSLSFKDGHLTLWNAVMAVQRSRELEAVRGRRDEQPLEYAPA